MFEEELIVHHIFFFFIQLVDNAIQYGAIVCAAVVLAFYEEYKSKKKCDSGILHV